MRLREFLSLVLQINENQIVFNRTSQSPHHSTDIGHRFNQTNSERYLSVKIPSTLSLQDVRIDLEGGVVSCLFDFRDIIY